MTSADPPTDWHRVASFGDIFDAPDFDFGRWVPSERHSDGAYTMPWFRPQPGGDRVPRHEGNLAHFYETGHLRAIIRRAAALAEAER